MFARFYGTVMPSIYAGNVWVIIYPEPDGKEEPTYWAQPSRPASDGNWNIPVQIGDRDTPPGHRFEVRAFASPTNALRVGKLADRGGPGCLNSFSAPISGAPAGVRLPRGTATG